MSAMWSEKTSLSPENQTEVETTEVNVTGTRTILGDDVNDAPW